jgi:hypothetical protein
MNIQILIPTAGDYTYTIEMDTSDPDGYMNIGQKINRADGVEEEILIDWLTKKDLELFAKAMNYAVAQLNK